MAFWSGPGPDQRGGGIGTPHGSISASKPVTKPTPAQAKHVRDLLTEVQYALVSDDVLQNCNQDTYDGRTNNFFRIVLIVYSLTILHEPTPSYTLGRQIGLVFSRSYSCLMTPSTDLRLPPPSTHRQTPVDFRLWAFFLAAAAMEGTEGDASRQFRTMFSQLATECGPGLLDGGYAALKARLAQYLWVPRIHDVIFERMWEESFRVTELGVM